MTLKHVDASLAFMAELMALKKEAKDELVSHDETTRIHVPIEFDAIDLLVCPEVLDVLGSDQDGSEVSPQGGIRAAGRKRCERRHVSVGPGQGRR